jgi:hypothetical protein
MNSKLKITLLVFGSILIFVLLFFLIFNIFESIPKPVESIPLDEYNYEEAHNETYFISITNGNTVTVVPQYRYVPETYYRKYEVHYSNGAVKDKWLEISKEEYYNGNNKSQ